MPNVFGKMIEEVRSVTQPEKIILYKFSDTILVENEIPEGEFYKILGVKFDKYYPESSVMKRGVSEVEKGLSEGVFTESNGAVVFPGEKYGLHTRVFINREGIPTYEAKDFGLGFTKWDDYKFDENVIITGNDIIDYIRFDSSKQKVIYDEKFIKRKLEIMKQNYYEIVEQIKDINEKSKVYLVGYYFPYDWVDEEYKEEVNKVFLMLNECIKDVSVISDAYYVDISEVSKEEYMFSKNQIYLNQSGHEYVFSVFKEGHLD